MVTFAPIKVKGVEKQVESIAKALNLEYIYGKLGEHYMIEWYKADGSEVVKSFDTLDALRGYLNGVQLALTMSVSEY